jgi:hydrogenase/urease accessory protein HupE
MKTRFLTLALTTLAAAPLWAHPGHGTTDPQSPAHLAEPVHLAPIAAVILGVAILAARKWSRRHR